MGTRKEHPLKVLCGFSMTGSKDNIWILTEMEQDLSKKAIKIIQKIVYWWISLDNFHQRCKFDGYK